MQLGKCGAIVSKRTGSWDAKFPCVSQVRAALDRLGAYEREAGEGDDEQPIFVLANGWRTGSTLLQRILVTDPSLLVWGEPLGRMALIPRMTEALCAFAEDWPPEDYWINGECEGFSRSWIANLFPPPEDLRAGLRQWMLHWLARPARERGFKRWGLKEVRLSAADAVVLRWLFPQARFVVLLRDPVDAYRSARRVIGEVGLWYRWPDHRVDSAQRYGQHWNRLAMSWGELSEDFGHIAMRYEDLAAGKVDFRALERRLDLSLDEQRALGARVGSTRNGAAVRYFERRRVLRATVEGRKALGY